MWTGWDPIFEYEGKTYAEMDKEAKVGDCIGPPHLTPRMLKPLHQNLISHRYKALVKFQQWLAHGQQ